MYKRQNWDDMQQVLPLLAKKKYYTRLRYGYARGSEPVEYVKRIRHYRDILNKKIKVESSGIIEDSETVGVLEAVKVSEVVETTTQ